LISQFDMSNRGIGSNAASPESDAAERKRLREFRTKMLRQQKEKEDHERRLKALREAEEREERVRKAKDLQKLKRTLELHCQNEERQRKVFERRAQLENEKADKRKDTELKTMKSVQKPAFLKCRSTAASKYVFGSSTPRSFSYMGKSVAAHLAAEVSGGVNRAGQKGVGLSTKKTVRGVGPGRDAAMVTSLYSLPKRECTAHVTDSMTKSITIGESSRFVSARNVRQNNAMLSTDVKRVAQSSGSKAVQRRAVSNRTSLNVAPAKTKMENFGISKPGENEDTAELLDSTCENTLLSLTSQSVNESDIHEWDLSDHTECCDLTIKSKKDASILEETAQVQEGTDENEISSLLLTTSPSVESRTASSLESVGKTPTDQTRSMGKVNGGNEVVSVNVNAKGVKLLTEEEARAALAEKRRLIREQRNLEILEKMERTSESIGKKEPDVEVEEKQLEEKLEEEKVVELTPTVEEQQRQEEILERKDTERRPDIKKKINEILTRARLANKVLETPKSSDGCASLLQEKTPKSEILSDKNSPSTNSLAVLEKLATSGRSIGPSLENILNRVRSPLIYGNNTATASTFSLSADSGASEQSNCSSSINGDASQFGASVSTKTVGESVIVDGNDNSVSYESAKSETDESELVNNIKKMALDDDSSADLSLTTTTNTNTSSVTTTTTSSDDVIDENANG
ncbi:hypothetical protein T10_7452, partial [Trichinella papuae]